MVYNATLGMGRDARTIGVRTNTTITNASFSLNAGASPAPNTDTIALPNNNNIFAIIATIKPQDRTQNSVNSKIVISINDSIVAQYLCPLSQTAGVDPNWQVNEIIPYNFNTNTNSNAIVTLSADNGGTTGFIMTTSITFVGIEI